MPKEFDDTPYLDLVSRAGLAFLTDTSYAIAIAKPAGALVARRRAKQELAYDVSDVMS